VEGAQGYTSVHSAIRPGPCFLPHRKRGEMLLRRFCTFVVASAMWLPANAQQGSQEEQALRGTLQVFFDGWNTHDVDKMVSVYADDIDHINVFGVWHKGKSDIRDDVARLHAAGLGAHKEFSIEKIRMLRPDVAVVIVKAISKTCNLGTYVLAKDQEKWRIVSFENVVCDQPNVPKY
jgi:uncharacterized protein (TIGR02246 family)